MFVQKLTNKVKIGYLISLFFGVITVFSGYVAYLNDGNTKQLIIPLITLGLVLIFFGLTLYGARKWRHQQQGRDTYRITIPSPVKIKSEVWMHRYAKLIAYVVRFAMACGFVPVLIGKPGAGKTLILEKATPGKVFGNTNRGGAEGNANEYSNWVTPSGGFAIEELTHSPAALINAVLQHIAKERFAVSIQTLNVLYENGFSKALRDRSKLFIHLK
jgi:hypothetical protein